MTRRSIFIGAAASLICAPAIVRAASLMPVRGLPLQVLNPLGEFYRRCIYHNLDFDLRTGRSMSTVENGKIISVADARRMVGYARTQGWLPPERLRADHPRHPPGTRNVGDRPSYHAYEVTIETVAVRKAWFPDTSELPATSS